MTSQLTAPEQWYGCTPGRGIAPGPNGPSPTGLVTDAAKAASAIAGSISIAETVSVAAAAGPIGAAIGALVALGFGLANTFSGCGETCTIASQYANEAETKLNAMLQQWNVAPQHTRSMQQIYLTICVGVFNALCTGCGIASSAGQRCISERLVRGGSAPWCPTVTGCDWVTVYYDPVANASDIVPDQVAQSPQQTVQTDPNTGQISYSQGTVPARSSDNSATYIVAAIAAIAFLKYRRTK